MILQSLAGLPAFLVYFCTSLFVVVVYLFVYTRVTPHNEFQLIRDNDPAAAIALGLSLLGFTLPVVSAIAHAANVVDCLIWSAIALLRSEEHTSELQSLTNLVCRLLLEKKKKDINSYNCRDSI